MSSEVAVAPDVVGLEVPKDAWTQPFWDAASRGELLLPQCGDCGTFRWPPGPFCPRCRAQTLIWSAPGQGTIYSFTILRQQVEGEEHIHAPALIEFPEAGGVRLVCAIAQTPVDKIRIGAPVDLAWSPALNAAIPIFRAI